MTLSVIPYFDIGSIKRVQSMGSAQQSTATPAYISLFRVRNWFYRLLLLCHILTGFSTFRIAL